MPELYGRRSGREILFGTQTPPAMDAEWREDRVKRDEGGKFSSTGGGGGKVAEPGATRRNPAQPDEGLAPRLPPIATQKEGRAVHRGVKAIAEIIDVHRSIGMKGIENRVSMQELRHAINDLWDTRADQETLRFSKADQKLHDTLHNEIIRRFDVYSAMQAKRGDDFAYMDNDEIHAETGLKFEGDSRMKPRIKKQLGLLPPKHIEALGKRGMTVQALEEIPRLPMTHGYAPGMQPAGLFRPNEGQIQVGDQISLPDGSKRMLFSRSTTLRHEIGHAIDHITEISQHPDFIQAVNEGVERMTEDERDAAAYYLGTGVADKGMARYARLKETFAEIYAYAYNDGDEADDGGTFGGMHPDRRAQLFGKAKFLVRRKLTAYFGDNDPHAGLT